MKKTGKIIFFLFLSLEGFVSFYFPKDCFAQEEIRKSVKANRCTKNCHTGLKVLESSAGQKKKVFLNWPGVRADVEKKAATLNKEAFVTKDGSTQSVFPDKIIIDFTKEPICLQCHMPGVITLKERKAENKKKGPDFFSSKSNTFYLGCNRCHQNVKDSFRENDSQDRVGAGKSVASVNKALIYPVNRGTGLCNQCHGHPTTSVSFPKDVIEYYTETYLGRVSSSKVKF